MRSWSEPAEAAPATVWELMARPARWPSWAPHLRRSWGLGSPEVEASRRGFVHLGGVVPVPVRVTQVTPGVSWSWRIGPITTHHLVEPIGLGSKVTLALEAPGPIEPGLAETYGRTFPPLLRRLAQQAAEAEGGGGART